MGGAIEDGLRPSNDIGEAGAIVGQESGERSVHEFFLQLCDDAYDLY